MIVADRSDLEQEVAIRREVAARESRMSLAGYLDNVLINSSPEPKLFKSVRLPWQTDIFRQADQALEYVAGLRPNYQGPRFFWFTLPRGWDKSSAIARRLNWLLYASKRRLMISTAATDEEQAGFIREYMELEGRLNPFLADSLHYARKTVYGPGGKVNVLSSNARSSYGRTDDVSIIDELTHWPKDDLWKVLYSGCEKRKGVVIILSNAGVMGTWQWDLWNGFREQPEIWSLFTAPPDSDWATWMDHDRVEAMARMLPKGMARRVIHNHWIDPGDESDFLNRGDVSACEALGRELKLNPTVTGRTDVDYVASIDYGPKRDRTALCVGHNDPKKRVQVDELRVWQGSPDSPISIQRVEKWVDDINKRFHLPLLVVDPYQMEGTIQRYNHHQQVVRFEARGGKANYELATTLRSLVVNRQLVWYPGAGDLVVGDHVETLPDELVSLVIRPTTYGYRFDHVDYAKGEKGELRRAYHDDRAVAIGMMALFAARNPPAPEWLPPPEVVQPTRKVASWDQRKPPPSRGLWGIRE